MRALSTVALAVLLAACSRRKAPEPAPSVVGSAAPVASAAPDWKAEPPKAWTDPRVIAALAADCSFLPPEPAIESGGPTHPADLFRCAPSFEQACVYAPCGEVEDTCKYACGGTCESCATSCAGACESCKGTCKDGACRTACATKCAECKQDCTRTLDRCVTGSCGKAATDCLPKLRAAYARCKRACDRRSDCQLACNRGESRSETCFDDCSVALDKTYAACRKRCETDSGGSPNCISDCALASCNSDLCQAGVMP